MIEDFGFIVSKEKDGNWKVYFPHKCGAWGIVPNTSDADYDFEPGSSKEEAAEDLKEFIRQANEALAALESGQEYGQKA